MVQMFHQESQTYAEHKAQHGRKDAVPQGIRAHRGDGGYRPFDHGGLYVTCDRARCRDTLGGHLADRVDDLCGPLWIGIRIANLDKLRSLDLLDGQVIQEFVWGRLQSQASDGLFGHGAGIDVYYHRLRERLETLDASRQVGVLPAPPLLADYHLGGSLRRRRLPQAWPLR